MQTKTISITLITLLVIGSCKTPSSVVNGNTSPVKPEFRIQAGINKGGITENTDIENEPGTAVDAFSGATKTGFNVGGRIAVPISRNAVETGLDVMLNQQSFTYSDAINNYQGERDLSLAQIMIPLTWNFGVLNHPTYGSLIEIKAGPVFQYNILNTKDEGQNLPGFSHNTFSAGFSAGISATTFIFDDGSGLGFFVEGYRGSQIYEDFYNQETFEIPGSSYAKFGLFYKLRSK